MSVSVRFENVSKKFTLYHGRARTLQEQLLALVQRSPNNHRASTETFWALRNVDFAVQQGQTFGLVGSNGSGKSTALKLIAQILEPTSGQIFINGRVSALLELGAGFHPDLTGRENIYLNGSLMGLSRQEMVRCFDDIVAFSELEEFIDMPVKHYSSGMYTRLAFAVAIHVDPEILIVDEVLAVGDAAFQRKCMERIAEMKRAGVTILLVSHDLETVARLCNQVVWLDKGQIHRIGDGRSVINEYVRHVNERQQRDIERQQQRKAAKAARVQEDRIREDPVPAEGEETEEAISSYQEGEILRVETLDAAGKPSTVFTTGESLTIRIHYRANQPIERPAFGLALHRDDDVHVTGPNTFMADYPIECIDGPGYIDYIVDSIPLTAGRYFVSASLYNEPHTYRYDFVSFIHSFIVQPQSVWDQLGVVKLPARWRLTQLQDKQPVP